MAQHIPVYGDWNKPNAGRDMDITKQFQMVSQARRDGRPMYHISNQHDVDSNLAHVGYDNNDSWETESTKSVPDNPTRQTRLPGGRGKRSGRGTNLHQSLGSHLSEGQKKPVKYDEDDSWETESIKSLPDNFTPKPLRVRHDRNDKLKTENTRSVLDNSILEARCDRNLDLPQIPQLPKIPKQPMAGYDNRNNWEAESRKSTPHNFTQQTRLNPRPAQRSSHDTNLPKETSLPKGPKSRSIGYNNRDNWELEKDKNIPENFTPQNRQNPRASSSSGRNSVQKNLDLTKGPTTRAGFEEKIRNGGPAGYDNKIHNLAIQTLFVRPSSTSEKRGHLVPLKEEEFMQKEAKIARDNYKLKAAGPSAPQFGKWNLDPDCTQEYTKNFAKVRDVKENRVMEESDDTPEQSHIYTEITAKKEKKRRNWFRSVTACF